MRPAGAIGWRKAARLGRAAGLAAMLAAGIPPSDPAQARQLRSDDPAAGQAAAELPVAGAVLRDRVVLGPFTVPLPPGPWTVYFADSATSRDGATGTERVGLLALDGDTVTQEIYARADVQRQGKGFLAFPECRNPSYFHEEQRSNFHTRAQDCWHVRAVSTVERADAGPRFQALYARTDAENLFLPAAMVGSRFHFANGDALLRVAYGWNPELLLRSRTDDKVWLAADWSKGEVGRDPRRLAVMRIMQRWGAEWYDRVATAFRAGVAAVR